MTGQPRRYRSILEGGCKREREYHGRFKSGQASCSLWEGDLGCEEGVKKRGVRGPKKSPATQTSSSAVFSFPSFFPSPADPLFDKTSYAHTCSRSSAWSTTLIQSYEILSLDQRFKQVFIGLLNNQHTISVATMLVQVDATQHAFWERLCRLYYGPRTMGYAVAWLQM